MAGSLKPRGSTMTVVRDRIGGALKLARSASQGDVTTRWEWESARRAAAEQPPSNAKERPFLHARSFVSVDRASRLPGLRYGLLWVLITCHFIFPTSASSDEITIAPFSADATIPLGHRCMGILPTKSLEIVDPLECHGFVLLGAGDPIVLAAFDWCEIRNDAYDQWRDALAEAAGTTRERVLVSSLHQHDAPVIDSGAQELLDQVGLPGELFDPRFHDDCIARVSAALTESLADARPVTHIGAGMARVEQVASTRRVPLADGGITFGRGSGSGGNVDFANAEEGAIDPFMHTVVFYEGDEPIVALHAYAVHPMSYYGRGGVSADFVGMARRLMQDALPTCHHIYVSGCSGDVTAGKYNDGSAEMRPILAQRLFEGMQRSLESATPVEVDEIALRVTPLELPFHDGPEFESEALSAVIHDDSQDIRNRILAAMGLASRIRVEEGRAIDFVCVDLGPAKVVLFPGEAFVGYQHIAHEMEADAMIVPIGYGECWPGYVPTDVAFAEGFDEGWRWVAEGCETRIREALVDVLHD